ncbi:murein biosynthesis integral membrane protein MurJ [Neisseria chenwenguii]|uniref:Probable lipid II flippase MurJ n=1 Tax=Neisseria chenwenguii TaxID=1853278 RepID=A0A220S266_9NEIS|nr:murein biosynthesis integral membrane protein MurJ [Neisseria chenwenguii]ASK27571.1 murein biosynthesis integral membrane protein MurJ [Neisseria chenwenguii]ROV55542.1 murein biosynthesis integral membrane protein MurJ [Neisseria chenwenguii]
MNLLGALAKVGSLTMVSRILGFVRDTIIARTFGAGMATDAFFVAFKLPNLLRRVFAEGAFAQAFVPILAEYKETKSPEATQEFVRYVAGMLSFILVIVTAAGILAAPWVIYVSAPGFAETPDKFQLSVDLLRVTFPYILLISLSSFVGSILNSYHKFSIPAFTPTFLNVSFIVFALFFAPYFTPPVMALAWAVFVGGLLQLGFQLPFLAKLGFLKLPKLDLKDAAVRRVMKQMAPAILGVSVAQISLVINTIFASFLQSGSVSWMYYADRLMELPTGVLGVALGTILLPTLSKHAAGNNPQEFSGLLDWGLRLCMLLAMPAAVGLAVLSFPLVATLFMYKEFSLNDAVMTQHALIAYSFGLIGLIMIKVLAPGFYAKQNIKTPVKIAVFTLVCTQLMNLAFIGPLKHVGLALAIGLGACLNAGLLFFLLRKHDIYRPGAGWGAFLAKMVLALAVMGGGLWAAQTFLPFEWVNVGGIRKAAQLCVLIAVGGSLYFLALGLLGFRPRDFKRSVER